MKKYNDNCDFFQRFYLDNRTDIQAMSDLAAYKMFIIDKICMEPILYDVRWDLLHKSTAEDEGLQEYYEPWMDSVKPKMSEELNKLMAQKTAFGFYFLSNYDLVYKQIEERIAPNKLDMNYVSKEKILFTGEMQRHNSGSATEDAIYLFNFYENHLSGFSIYLPAKYSESNLEMTLLVISAKFLDEDDLDFYNKSNKKHYNEGNKIVFLINNKYLVYYDKDEEVYCVKYKSSGYTDTYTGEDYGEIGQLNELYGLNKSAEAWYKISSERGFKIVPSKK